MDDHSRSASSQSEMTMTIVRPDWQRFISMKGWSKGRDLSLVIVTAPAKEKGQVFIKRKTEMWNWVPSIDRIIKVPPSMISQSWMGSDYTNDDLLRESSIVHDYTHALTGSETVNGYDCYKIELIPLPEAAVVWGKVIMWVSKKEYLNMKTEQYDEDGVLVNVHTASAVKKMNGRTIATVIDIVPVGKKGQKTVVEIKS
jgi:outer membrane lipoprotein-sorting protein